MAAWSLLSGTRAGRVWKSECHWEVLPSTPLPRPSVVLTYLSKWSFQGPSVVDSSYLPFSYVQVLLAEVMRRTDGLGGLRRRLLLQKTVAK